MSKAEEKAKELVQKYRKYVDGEIAGEKDFVFSKKQETKQAKQCALICVENEHKAILKEIEKVSEYIPIEIYTQQVVSIQKEYNEVKQEINKLK